MKTASFPVLTRLYGLFRMPEFDNFRIDSSSAGSSLHAGKSGATLRGRNSAYLRISSLFSTASTVSRVSSGFTKRERVNRLRYPERAPKRFSRFPRFLRPLSKRSGEKRFRTGANRTSTAETLPGESVSIHRVPSKTPSGASQPPRSILNQQGERNACADSSSVSTKR